MTSPFRLASRSGSFALLCGCLLGVCWAGLSACAGPSGSAEPAAEVRTERVRTDRDGGSIDTKREDAATVEEGHPDQHDESSPEHDKPEPRPEAEPPERVAPPPACAAPYLKKFAKRLVSRKVRTIAEGTLSTAQCQGMVRQLAAVQGVVGVAPTKDAKLDAQPDGRTHCAIKFQVKAPVFAQLSWQWRSLDAKAKAPTVWMRVDRKIWVDWRPAANQQDWTTTPVIFHGYKKRPWWVWLTAGTHTLTVSWSSHDIALGRWRWQSLKDIPAPPTLLPYKLTWTPKLPSETLNVQDFGAKGDGKTDDQPAFQKAVDQLKKQGKAGVVLVPKGRYLLKTPIVISSDGIVLRGEGVRSQIEFELKGKQYNWQGGLIARGGGCTKVRSTLTSDGKAGSATLTLKDTTGFKVGDPLELRVDDSHDKYGGAKNLSWKRYRIDFLSITAIQGKQVTVHRPLTIDFPAARNARVCVYRPIKDVGFENFALRSRNDLSTNGILAVRTMRTWVRDVHISQIARFGVHFAYVREGLIEHSTYRDARNFGGGGHGYGFEVAYSTDCVMARTQNFNLRHGLAVQFGSASTRVYNNEVAASTLAAIDVHGEYNHHTIVAGNWLRESGEGIIVGGGGPSHGNDGPGNIVRGNVAGPKNTVGLHVGNRTAGVIFRDNHVFGAILMAIWVYDRSHEVLLQDNLLEGDSAQGIRLDSNKAKIQGNLLRFPKSSTDTITISDRSEGYLVRDNWFDGSRTLLHPKHKDAQLDANCFSLPQGK